MTAGGDNFLHHQQHLNVSMVEKIRESYQKHSRNISTVSDISVSLSEPLRRDPTAEIRSVLLCDSEVERNCVFEAFKRVLADGRSQVGNVQLLQHHWEQPHVDSTASATAENCKSCVRMGPQSGTSTPTTSAQQQLHEGFFRFSLRSSGAVFRLMLLSKDRQNLLKIYSFDFLIVGMRVTNHMGELEEHIWEFEWKRLNKHSKKAVAPIILLAYLRDSELSQGGGSGETSGHGAPDAAALEKARRRGRHNHVIPRFCDLTDSSLPLQELFEDVERLYKHPGFVLQQCAYVNNQYHFAKIMESPHLTEEDVRYRCDTVGDNPIMIAAKLRHKDLVSSVLRSPRFLSGERNDVLRDLIHSRNDTGQTLLAMVALQGPELEEQKLLILQKEIQIHCESELTHEADQLKLQRCLRGQLKSSAEAAIILEQARALQGIPKTERELKAESGKVWSRLFFASLLLSLIFNAIDTGSDILLMIRYYGEMMGEVISASNGTCVEEDTTPAADIQHCFANGTGLNNTMSIQCFPLFLSPEQKFGYTLFFIVVPWPFFIYEFFTSSQYQSLVAKGGEIAGEMAACRGFASLGRAYFKAIIYSLAFVCCFLFWPIAVLFIKYYNDGKYYLAKGVQKAEREKNIEASEVLYATARVMEVSLESSFQPTIQLYILFPVLVRTMTANYFSFRLFSVCKDESLNFPIPIPDQTISIITSILSLAWCFTLYHATLKRGALDKDLAALFYRLVLFLSVLFQIVGRLFILVLFSYSFGPGMYYPVLVFLACHIFAMSVLHFIFSDARKYWVKGGLLNLSFFHYILGNAMANIYIHNWIRMDPLLIQFSKPLQHVSTLMRQLVFDLVFMSENIILLWIALNSNITELRENRLSFAVVLLGFTFLGLVLKAVYYRYLHMWAWLIMDYITQRQDGHWMCILISNMYLCGKLKERRLILCCIPRPIYNFFASFCQKRGGTSCSVCSAIVTAFLMPVVLAGGILVLVVGLVVATAFMPFFLVGVLPCIIFIKCRHTANSSDVGGSIKLKTHQQTGLFVEDGEEEVKLMEQKVREVEPVEEEQESPRDESDVHNHAPKKSGENGDLNRVLVDNGYVDSNNV